MGGGGGGGGVVVFAELTGILQRKIKRERERQRERVGILQKLFIH